VRKLVEDEETQEVLRQEVSKEWSRKVVAIKWIET